MSEFIRSGYENGVEFCLDPTNKRCQQDLAEFYQTYLPTKDPELVRTFSGSWDGTSDFQNYCAQTMALHSCLPVAMWTYLKSAGAMGNIILEEFVDTVWDSYSRDKKMWLRGPMTRVIREKYKIRIISAGIRWLNETLNSNSVEGMVASGYISDSDVDAYVDHLHGRNVEQIIESTPCVVTIQNTVGKHVAHAVVAWEIADQKLVFVNVDKRDIPESDGFNRTPSSVLDTTVTYNGAVSVLLS